jgi:hypothetical protein
MFSVRKTYNSCNLKKLISIMNGSTISNIYLQQGRIRPYLQLNDKLMALKLIMFNLQYKKSVLITNKTCLKSFKRLMLIRMVLPNIYT